SPGISAGSTSRTIAPSTITTTTSTSTRRTRTPWRTIAQPPDLLQDRPRQGPSPDGYNRASPSIPAATQSSVGRKVRRRIVTNCGAQGAPLARRASGRTLWGGEFVVDVQTSAPAAATGTEHVDPDYPLSQVPASARRGFWSLTVVLMGFTFFTPTLLAGAQVGAAFTFSALLSVLVVGSPILGAYVAALSAVGAHTGLTTVLISRYTLGTGGAKWADLLLGGTQVGWYGVAVATLAELTAQAFGLQSYTWLLMIVGGALMGITAYYGYRGMEVLSTISVPLLFILAFWVVARSLGEVGGWAGMFAQQPVETMTWATAVTIIVGTFASGGTQTPNWSRFSRSWQQALWAALIAFFLGNGLMLFFGAVGA